MQNFMLHEVAIAQRSTVCGKHRAVPFHHWRIETALAPVDYLAGQHVFQRGLEPSFRRLVHVRVRLAQTDHCFNETMIEQRQAQLYRRRHAEPVALSDAVFTQVRVADQARQSHVDVGPWSIESKQARRGVAVHLLAKTLTEELRRFRHRSLKVADEIVENHLVGRSGAIASQVIPTATQTAEAVRPFAKLPARQAAGQIQIDVLRQRADGILDTLKFSCGSVGRRLHPTVTPEKFVATLALQHDWNVLFAREFHHRVITKARDVGDRIVAPVNQVGKERDHFAGRELGVVKRHAELIGERACVRTFIVRETAGITDAERVHRAWVLARGEGGDRARVETAAQRDTDRDVRANDDLADGFELFANQGCRIALDGRRVFHEPVTPLVDLPRFDVDDQQRGCVELAHAFQGRQWFGHVLVMKVKIDRGWIELERNASRSQQRFHLRREEHAVVRLVKIDRLLAHAIAADDEPLASRVPERKRKHAAQVLDEIKPVLFVEMKNGFAVAVGLKLMAELVESLAQFDEVVNLAVRDERECAVFVVKRLPTAVEIDDAQTTHRQHHVTVLKLTRAVRATMRKALVGRSHARDIGGGGRGLGDDFGGTNTLQGV